MRLPATLICAVLILALSFALASCNAEKPREEMEQKISTAYEETKELARDARKQIKDELDQTLAGLDKKIEALQARAKDAGGEIKDEYKDAIRTLKEKRKAAEDELEKLDDLAADKWEDARDKAEDAVEKLQETYDDVASRIQS